MELRGGNWGSKDRKPWPYLREWLVLVSFVNLLFECSDLFHGQFLGQCSVQHGNAVIWVSLIMLLIVICSLMGRFSGVDPKRGSWLHSPVSFWMISSRVNVSSVLSSAQPRRGSVLSRFLWFWFCFSAGFRYGEAAHPGPENDVREWSVGLFNPSGLNSKLDVLKEVPGDCWIGCESHFTKLGFQRFKKGLHALDIPFRYCQHGAFCQPRSTAEVGGYSGIVALSRYPLRVLPHQFDEQMFQTARLQVFGACMQGTWIQIGGVYGYPDSPQYLQRTFRTECLLDAVITRIAEQATGPRIICGDLNHGPNELQQLQRLASLGFREIQEIAMMRWGQQVVATGRGNKNIDQVWLSPEMQALLLRVELLDDLWSGHIAVQGVFAADGVHHLRYHWRFPKPMQWPPEWQCNVTCDWADPTTAYASLWYQLEMQASQQSSKPCPSAAWGRATTLQPKVRRNCLAPLKPSREGEIQPGFFGTSLKYSRWFRQLRRIQALDGLVQKAGSPQLLMHQHEVWRAIRFAPGFDGGFMRWCQTNMPEEIQPYLSVIVPPSDVVNLLFTTFAQQVKQLEVYLSRSRCNHARARRRANPHLIFRDCAREQPEKVDTIIQQVHLPVDEVRTDDSSIVLPHPVKLLPDAPLVCNGQVSEVIYHDHDQLWLNEVDHICVGDTLLQERVLSSDHDILQEFGKVWQSRWQKLERVQPSQWEDIMQFCTRHLPTVQWHFSPWSIDTLKGLIRHKKKRAAVGLDGVSRNDLLALPPNGLGEIIKLYENAERGGEWPHQLLQGCVSSLHKNKGDGGVDSYRPITIYPMVMRLWSTQRARESIHSLASILPPSVKGGVPRQQSSAIWFEISQMLEVAYVEDSRMCGLALDIQRAFNSLPRLPIWHALAQMNFPRWLLGAWARFVCKQERHFKIRTSIGAGHPSTVGYPEGCAFSVFAMCVVDLILDFWIGSLNHSIGLYTYVDDWQLTFEDSDSFGIIWAHVQEFARIMDVDIDCKKSFLWAAYGADRAALRSHHHVDVVLSAKDLGAHHNFCRRKGNAHIVARVKALQQHWNQLAASQSPYYQKVRSLYQVAWPRAFVGISITALGSQHFATLRTGAIRGLKASRIGSNPVLHLATNGVGVDPEMWAIMQSFRELRDLSNFEATWNVLTLLASDPDCVPANGPTALLSERCRRLGWVPLPSGLMQDDSGQFCVLTQHWDALVARIVAAWPKIMASEVAHRPSFQGIQFADLTEVLPALKRYGPADQVYLRCCLDGTLYTDTTKNAEDRGPGSLCVCCGAPDSFFHRIWQCPYFEDCRENFPYHNLLPMLPQCLSCHGWPIKSAAVEHLQQWFHQPAPDFRNLMLPPGLITGTIHLFTDGACACPAEPKVRFASWALTMACSRTSMLSHLVVDAGHVEGLHQTAYRGELVAVLAALRFAAQHPYASCVWCDNQAVVRRARKVLSGCRIRRNKPHSDLWLQIEQMVTDSNLAERVTMVKVVSHCGGSSTTPLEQWAFWHNKLADEAATSVNFRRPQTFWNTWFCAVQSVQFLRDLHSHILAVLLRVARKGALTIANRQFSAARPHQGQDEERQGSDVILRMPAQWHLPDVVVRKYRYENVLELHRWWTTVGVEAVSSNRPLRWISGLQLYADFFAFSGYKGMFCRGHSCWLVDPTDAPTDLNVVQRSTMFLRVWKGYVKAHGFATSIQLARPFSGAISYWTQCYRLPWCGDRLNRIDVMLLQLCNRQVVAPKDLQEIVFFPRPNAAEGS